VVAAVPKRSVLDEDEPSAPPAAAAPSAAATGDKAPGASTMLLPPQMRRPNVSTEDAGWVSLPWGGVGRWSCPWH
jgi:hypothetical protein